MPAPPPRVRGREEVAAGAPRRPPQDDEQARAAPHRARAPGPLVAVSLSAPYPFEVIDGTPIDFRRRRRATNCRRSRTARPCGVVAPDVFLDHAVQGGRWQRRTIRVFAALARPDRHSGRARRLPDHWWASAISAIGPFPPVPAVAGDYQVSLACPDGQNPVIQTTVTQGFTARVVFQMN